MNKYLNALACRKDNGSGYVFSLDELAANGAAFAVAFITMWFSTPHIPGLKKVVGK